MRGSDGAYAWVCVRARAEDDLFTEAIRDGECKTLKLSRADALQSCKEGVAESQKERKQNGVLYFLMCLIQSSYCADQAGHRTHARTQHVRVLYPTDPKPPSKFVVCTSRPRYIVLPKQVVPSRLVENRVNPPHGWQQDYPYIIRLEHLQ